MFSSFSRFSTSSSSSFANENERSHKFALDMRKMCVDHLLIWLSRLFRRLHRILMLSSTISIAQWMVMAITTMVVAVFVVAVAIEIVVVVLCTFIFYYSRCAKKSISNLVVIVCVPCATCDTIIVHFYLNCLSNTTIIAGLLDNHVVQTKKKKKKKRAQVHKNHLNM